MQRVPEPELMNDWEQAKAYAGADFSEPHDYFVSLCQRIFSSLPAKAWVLDLGCGPADVSRRFARAWPDCRIHGVDGATSMLQLGRDANLKAGLAHRIELIEKVLPCESLPNESYDAIISNSLLHHLPDPDVLWQSLLQFGRPGTVVFIMDLLRPPSRELAQQLVDRYAASEPDVLRNDFYASLCAAFSEEEINMQLANNHLTSLQVRIVSDRHFIVHGFLS